MLIDWPLFCWITLGLLVAASLLHLLPYSGKARESLLDACCRAPLLDGIVCYFTILPLVVGPLVSGWAGLVSGAFAQLATLLIWQTIHEAVHRDATKGPRIIKVLNRKFGAVRNLTAIYITGFAIPIFWFVRMARIDPLSPNRQTGQLSRLQCRRLDQCFASEIQRPRGT